MCAPLSPWVRFVSLTARPRPSDTVREPGAMIWLSTGDEIGEYECWPVEHLPVRCALCGRRARPLGADPITPLFWGGKVLWYCSVHFVTHPPLGERMQERIEETAAAVGRLYPMFDPYAAPGEEWV